MTGTPCFILPDGQAFYVHLNSRFRFVELSVQFDGAAIASVTVRHFNKRSPTEMLMTPAEVLAASEPKPDAAPQRPDFGVPPPAPDVPGVFGYGSSIAEVGFDE